MLEVLQSYGAVMSSQVKAAKKPIAGQRRKGTSQRILDASEALFATRGYDGTSLRDICERADTPLSLAYHHYRSKESLFKAVVERRAADHVASIASSLERERVAAAGEPIELEPLIRAFLRPYFDRYLNGDSGWKNYIRLLSLSVVQYRGRAEDYITPFLDIYSPVIHEYTKCFFDIFPNSPREDVYWSKYFLEMITTIVLIDDGVSERSSEGLCRSGDFETIIEKMVPFFAGGFKALMSSQTADKSAPKTLSGK